MGHPATPPSSGSTCLARREQRRARPQLLRPLPCEQTCRAPGRGEAAGLCGRGQPPPLQPGSALRPGIQGDEPWWGGRGGEQLQSVVAGVGALPGLGTHRKGPTLPLSSTCLTHLCGWSWGRWQGRGETRGLFRAVSPVSTLHRPAWRQWVCRLEPSWGCPRGVRWRRMGCSHGEPFGETKQHICQPKSGPPGTVPEPCTPL